MKMRRMGRSKKQKRKEEALFRAEVRDMMTPQLQLDRLDARLGYGVGATKERCRLLLLMAAERGEDEAQQDSA